MEVILSILGAYIILSAVAFYKSWQYDKKQSKDIQELYELDKKQDDKISKIEESDKKQNAVIDPYRKFRDPTTGLLGRKTWKKE